MCEEGQTKKRRKEEKKKKNVYEPSRHRYAYAYSK